MRQKAANHIQKHGCFGPSGDQPRNYCYSMRDGIENLTAELLDKHYAVNIRAMALLCAEFVKR